MLYRIYPDSVIDEEKRAGTEYNRNGITFIREYCEKALPSIKGMSLRCEFADADRTVLLGHGDTDMVDGLPVFEDAVVVGTFTDGYIAEMDTDNGPITVCVGEGEIDSLCYHNFVEKLERDICDGNYPDGSVEIMRCPGNDGIVYKYGYKEFGRIPTEFIHSGFALLGVTPADENAGLIELNKDCKEGIKEMTEKEIKAIVEQAALEITSCTEEIEKSKNDFETRLAEANNAKEEVAKENEELKTELEKAKAELSELKEKAEKLETEVNDVKTREKVSELESAISEFSDDEKAYAEKEIAAYREDPFSTELNSIIGKIWEGIGRTSREKEKAEEAKVSEQNDARADIEDIFSEVDEVSAEDNESIF